MRILRQLGREDWIEIGLHILCECGPSALRVEPTAKRLGVSKGSFYWHFRDRAAWRDALLSYWEHLAFAHMLQGRGRPGGVVSRQRVSERHRRSVEEDLTGNPGAPSNPDAAARRPAAPGLDLGRLEAALRVWAMDDAWAARALMRVQAERQRRVGLAAPQAAVAA